MKICIPGRLNILAPYSLEICGQTSGTRRRNGQISAELKIKGRQSRISILLETYKPLGNR
jgi:hypothetical protein